MPTEISAAFGLAQLKKLKKFKQIRQKNFRQLKNNFTKYQEIFILPKELPGVDTAWLAFPLTIKKNVPFSRYDIVSFLEKNGVQTRPVFAGNILKHPGFKNIPVVKRKSGYPVSDHVMKNSFLIGCHQGINQKQLNYLKELFDKFLKLKRIKY